jgi:molybdopterin-guanine dinucleotide biosynthesis protein
MKIVVVGGQARDIGKTGVMTGLMRRTRELEWTAVKVTPHLHGLAPSERRGLDFLLIEEHEPSGRRDTGRYLAAGAKRAWWLQAEPAALRRAAAALHEALKGTEHVIIESNRIVESATPTVFLGVVASDGRPVKPSAQRLLTRADAFVAVLENAGRAEPFRGFSGRLRGKPVFQVSRRGPVGRDLVRFIRRKLAEGRDAEFRI